MLMMAVTEEVVATVRIWHFVQMMILWIMIIGVTSRRGRVMKYLCGTLSQVVVSVVALCYVLRKGLLGRMHRDRDYGARFNRLLRSKKLELFEKVLDYETVIGIGYYEWRVLFNMLYMIMVAVGAYPSYVVFSTSLTGIVLLLIEILLAGVMLAQVIYLVSSIQSWCRELTDGLDRALAMADNVNNCTN